MRKIDAAIIHCADTYPDMDIGVEEIRRWHVEDRGWKDVGYHYIIRRDGTLENGRDLDGDGDVLEEVGAHAMGFNAHSVGICLVGGKSRKTKGPDFNFTKAQMIKLHALVSILRDMFPGIEVIGHRDVSGKACPSFDAKSYFA